MGFVPWLELKIRLSGTKAAFFVFFPLGDVQMSKFHFEIVDGYTIEDAQGMELPTGQHAKRVAEEMAKRIANDLEDDSFKDVVVKTPTGKVIHRTPIKSDPKS